jgi:2-keto-3-deoxy-L-rhamnonate aldolase RhmA
LKRESVNIPIHSCSANVARAVCMATSSARMIVRVSSVPTASIQRVVEVGMCTIVAPNLG